MVKISVRFIFPVLAVFLLFFLLVSLLTRRDAPTLYGRDYRLAYNVEAGELQDNFSDEDAVQRPTIWRLDDFEITVHPEAWRHIPPSLFDKASRRLFERLRDAGFEQQPIGEDQHPQSIISGCDEDEEGGARPLLLILPEPSVARNAAGAFWADRIDEELSVESISQVSRKASSASFFSRRKKSWGPEGMGGSSMWVLTSLDWKGPLPGTLKFSKPWLKMGRIITCRFSNMEGDGQSDLLEQTASRLDRTGTSPAAMLWSLPLNDVVTWAVYADDRGARSWMAYSIADAVGPKRVKAHTTPDGEWAYSIPLVTSEHDPRGFNDHQLMRLPAANQYHPTDYPTYLLPGERIALHEWFADPEHGGAVLSCVPGDSGPVWRLSPLGSLDDLEEVDEGSIRALAIFNTVSDDRLAEAVDHLVRIASGE